MQLPVVINNSRRYAAMFTVVLALTGCRRTPYVEAPVAKGFILPADGELIKAQARQ